MASHPTPPESVTFTSSSQPSPVDTFQDYGSNHTSPPRVPLPPSPPCSPPIVDGAEGDIGFRDAKQPGRPLVFGGKVDSPPVVVELAGLDVEDRKQMDELMSLGSSKAACGQSAPLGIRSRSVPLAIPSSPLD